MILSRLSGSFVASLLFVCPLIAQQNLHVDPSQSEVHFTLSDSTHPVKGIFHVQNGTVTFDAQGHMYGSVVVDARTGDSGNSSRDKKMEQDQLKASSFSTVTFEPTGYTGSLAPNGDSTITVNGTFTLLGTPHPISVPMKVQLGDGQCKASGSFVVPYVQWGVKDPSNFLLRVGKEVTIDLLLAGPLATATH